MIYKIGVMGLSDGNGHPYSWSAIFNGYSPKEMGKCIFPVIPKYLSEQKWPESRITNAEVKGVWSQSKEISKSIAKSSLIENVYITKEELVDNSDLILLARDDAENHYENAYYAINAKKPIFIDKPIALSLKDLERLYEVSHTSNQIFSCSSMSFCPTFSKLSNCLKDKRLKLIELTSPKSWKKYAVHLIDPLIKNLRSSYLNCYSLKIVDKKESNLSSLLTLSLTTSNHKDPIIVRIITTGDKVGEIGFHALNDKNRLIYKDHHRHPFDSFKGALETFLLNNSENHTGYKFDYDHHKEVVRILQAGI